MYVTHIAELGKWWFFSFDMGSLIARIVMMGACIYCMLHSTRAILHILLGFSAGFFGWLGLLLVRWLGVTNHLIEMIFFVTIAFFGTCLTYLLTLFWHWIGTYVNGLKYLSHQEWWLVRSAATAGTCILAHTFWKSRWLILCIILLGIISIIWAKFHPERRMYRTYEHLFRMPGEEER